MQDTFCVTGFCVRDKIIIFETSLPNQMIIKYHQFGNTVFHNKLTVAHVVKIFPPLSLLSSLKKKYVGRAASEPMDTRVSSPGVKG